mmetsp:Transcript_10054/g.33220  ORF Transcript_10054/g.33220 Transcript_10054/m.33220 type:complete len:202 (-) Transcript_10054:442-1047(-)
MVSPSRSNAPANLMITFTADMTTAEFACCSLGETRSMMLSASLAPGGSYFARASRIETCPHSVHSFIAASSFPSTAGDMSSTLSSPEASAISFRAATALATTVGLASETSSRKSCTKPRSKTSSGEMSYSLATHTAAVLRTYGSSSFKHLSRGSIKYSVIFSTRMQPMVRIASARTSGLGSQASFTNVFTARRAMSGCVLA